MGLGCLFDRAGIDIKGISAQYGFGIWKVVGLEYIEINMAPMKRPRKSGKV